MAVGMMVGVAVEVLVEVGILVAVEKTSFDGVSVNIIAGDLG